MDEHSKTGDCKQGPPARFRDLRHIEQHIARMIQHENELLNHRIQWFLTIQGFLFTAVALFGNNPGRRFFGLCIAITGIAVCLSFGMALQIGRKGFGSLVEQWKNAVKGHEQRFFQAGVFGYLAGERWETFLAPWRILPYIISFAWIGIIVFLWMFPGGNAAGTFVPVTVKTPLAAPAQHGKPLPIAEKIQAFDTRDGIKRDTR